jgi:hypothetical protein
MNPSQLRPSYGRGDQSVGALFLAGGKILLSIVCRLSVGHIQSPPPPMDIRDSFLEVELPSHIHLVPMVLMCGSIPLLLHTSLRRGAISRTDKTFCSFSFYILLSHSISPTYNTALTLGTLTGKKMCFTIGIFNVQI